MCRMGWCCRGIFESAVGAVFSKSTGGMTERPNVLVLKTSDGQPSQGSNPCASAKKPPEHYVQGAYSCLGCVWRFLLPVLLAGACSINYRWHTVLVPQ